MISKVVFGFFLRLLGPALVPFLRMVAAGAIFFAVASAIFPDFESYHVVIGVVSAALSSAMAQYCARELRRARGG